MAAWQALPFFFDAEAGILPALTLKPKRCAVMIFARLSVLIHLITREADDEQKF